MNNNLFEELLDAYGLGADGEVQNGIDPVAYIDGDDNIVLLDCFTLKGHYNHVVDATDELKVVDEGDCDYWNEFADDVDINIYSCDNGVVKVSFYPVVDGNINTNDTRLEGIRCDVERLRK